MKCKDKWYFLLIGFGLFLTKYQSTILILFLAKFISLHSSVVLYELPLFGSSSALGWDIVLSGFEAQ